MSSHPNDRMIPASQLPTGKAISFIAYQAPEALPDPNGEPVTGRAQVLVRWFDAIKIASITDGGRNQTDTVAIKFDPESVGFSNEFSAYMNPSDPTLSIVRKAFEDGMPLTIAIESVRKVKTKKTKEPISRTVPINALRGAQEDGMDASMEASGDTIRNVVALVEGHPAETLSSDPSEWKFLAKNRTGNLAPQGWRVIRDKEDWRAVGYIVASGTPSGNGEISESVINAIVTGVVEGLEGAIGGNGGIESSDIAREVRRGVFNEGKPWNTRTSNGMVNLGGYLLSKGRAVFIKAIEVTGDAVEAQELSQRILTLTDRVQENAYGHGILADRLAKSHTEAGHWVNYVIDTVHDGGEGQYPYPLYEATDESTLARRTKERDDWCAMVAENATVLFRNAAQLASDYLQAVAKRGNQPEPRVEGTSQREALRGTGQARQQDDNSRNAVVRDLAAAIDRAWSDPRDLTVILQQIKKRDLDKAPVALRLEGNKAVVRAAFDVGGEDGWERGPALGLIQYRLNALSEGRNRDGSATTAEQPKEQQQAQSAPPAESPAPDAQPAPAAASEEYSPAVVSLIEKLRTATADTLPAIYSAARDGNLLDEAISVYPDTSGQLTFGSKNQKGYIVQPLSAVIERMLEKAAPVSAEPAAEPAPADVQPAATPQEHTEEPVAPEEAATSEPLSDTEAQAQDLAARAASLPLDGDYRESLTALMDEARSRGLSEVEIVVGEDEGGLMFYLKHLLNVAPVPAAV